MNFFCSVKEFGCTCSKIFFNWIQRSGSACLNSAEFIFFLMQYSSQVIRLQRYYFFWMSVFCPHTYKRRFELFLGVSIFCPPQNLQDRKSGMGTAFFAIKFLAQAGSTWPNKGWRPQLWRHPVGCRSRRYFPWQSFWWFQNPVFARFWTRSKSLLGNDLDNHKSWARITDFSEINARTFLFSRPCHYLTPIRSPSPYSRHRILSSPYSLFLVFL